MGLWKRQLDDRGEARRFNAARRRAARLRNAPSSRLISLETVSETERYAMAQDAELVSTYNKEVERWQDSVVAQLRATIAAKSLRIARELEPRTYTDKYGVIDRLGFSFPRHGIYIHHGAGKGYGGFIGSKWTKTKRINGIEVSTGIVRHTNPASLTGNMGTGNRQAFEWFDPVIKNRIPELMDIVTKYFDTMIVDASKIFIEK